MTVSFKDIYDFSQKTQEYVHTVVALVAKDESQLQAAGIRVLERLSIVLQAMLEGTPAEEMAQHLRKK